MVVAIHSEPTLAPERLVPRGDFTAWAADLGTQVAPFAAAHDREGSFVSEAFELLRESGYLALAVPQDLGGSGATLSEVAWAQGELARHCASTALATAMHMHTVVTAAWRRRRGVTGVEGLLRRVANNRLVILSSGGSDGTTPSAVARRAEGGYRVSGRKRFVSGSPAGTVLSTWAVSTDEPGSPSIIGFGLPMASEGVRILDTWDTLGMRGTASHDVDIDDVFVSDAQISARRPYGVLDPLLSIAYINAIPIISAVYLGVAQAARDEALRLAAKAAPAGAVAIRLAGELEAELREGRWALEGALAEVGDNPEPTPENLATVMLGKRSVACHAQRVVELAMDLAGGQGFYRTSPLERAYRDIRAIRYHPLPLDATLDHAGRVVLGLASDTI